MIIIIIKTVVLILDILVILLMIFSRKYNFCIWKRCKIPKVHISNKKYIYDKFNQLTSSDDVYSRIEISLIDNTIHIETKNPPEVTPEIVNYLYKFLNYRITDNGTKVKFMFEDNYEIKSAILFTNNKHIRCLRVTTKSGTSIVFDCPTEEPLSGLLEDK